MENSILNTLPSIRESISVNRLQPPQNSTFDENDSDDDDDYHYDSADENFSFDVSTTNDCGRTHDLTADEIFDHGHLIPLCFVANRTTSLDDTDIGPSSTQPNAASESYDIPRTAPGSPIKSWSTGTTRRRNPIHEFFFGWRSHSDGQEKLGFVEKGSGESVKGKKKKTKEKGKEKKKESKEVNKTDQGKNGEKGIVVKARERDMFARSRRRSFLPYVGIFGGSPMHDFPKKFFF